MIRCRSDSCSSASAKWLTMPDRNAAPKLTNSAITATTTIVHTRPAAISPPDSAGSRDLASSTIATNGTTPLTAPSTLSAMIAAKLPFTGAKKETSAPALVPSPRGSSVSGACVVIRPPLSLQC